MSHRHGGIEDLQVERLEGHLPRGILDDESGRLRTEKTQKFISFNIARWANVSAPEFDDLRHFVHRLGQANIEPADEPGIKPNDEPTLKTSIITPENIHITSIYSFDARQILMRAFGNDKGKIQKTSRVRDSIKSMQRQYELKLRQRNQRVQQKVVEDLEIANGRIGAYAPEDSFMSGHSVLRMTSGIFDTLPELRGFGGGNKFGLVFSEEAKTFLDEERAVNLQFILDKLKIRSIDSDLEDRIFDNKHHATLIKKGGTNPHSINYPEDLCGDIIPTPEVLVTGLEPKMRYIDGRNSRAA